MVTRALRRPTRVITQQAIGSCAGPEVLRMSRGGLARELPQLTLEGLVRREIHGQLWGCDHEQRSRKAGRLHSGEG